MRLVVSFRVSIPDNPEAETSLRWMLLHHLARADLAQAIAQLLPPGMPVEVKIIGAEPDRRKPAAQRRDHRECYEYPKTGKLVSWWRR